MPPVLPASNHLLLYPNLNAIPLVAVSSITIEMRYTNTSHIDAITIVLGPGSVGKTAGNIAVMGRRIPDMDLVLAQALYPCQEPM